VSGWASFGIGTVLGELVAAGLLGGLVAARRRALSAPLHELRGALAAIQLGLFALERRGLAAPVGDRVDALRTQAERAHIAVEEVDGIRMLRRPSPERVELIEVGTLVRRRVSAWSRLGEARRRNVELRWPIGPAVVRTDPGRLGQALDNLIVNALDHGGGIVRVSGSLRERTIGIVVSDQGAGFGRPLTELLRRPWQARHGHGLVVAARAVELYGGRLTVTSGPIGSRVEIELPLAEPCTSARSRPPVAARLSVGASGSRA
jgi:signal transduction histidine kinase